MSGNSGERSAPSIARPVIVPLCRWEMGRARPVKENPQSWAFHQSASREGRSESVREAAETAAGAFSEPAPRRAHGRLFVWRRAGLGGPIGLTPATGDAKSAAIRLEATHAINAHRGDRSGGNVARPSRQPSHSNAVVRGALVRAMPFITIA